MADPLGSIFSYCIIPPSQQHLLYRSLFASEDEIFPLNNPPEPYFLHPMFAAAADADTISIHTPPESPSSSSDSASSPYEEFQTPPEDSRRSISEESDHLYSPGGGIDGGGLDEEMLNLGFEEEISVGEKRVPENRSPIDEVLPPSKKLRVSKGVSGAIEDDDDRDIDTEVIEEYDDDEDEEEVYCYYCADDEGNGDKEDGGETNAEQTGDNGEIGMLLEVLALLAREAREEYEVVDVLETMNHCDITLPGLNGDDEELH